MRPAISVIIPAYNGGSDLAALLESLQGQPGVELQILVLDSGSTDGSDLLANQFRQTQWHRFETKDFSHSATRNAGARLAEHPLVFFTVQDARFETGAFAKLGALFEEHKLAALSAAETPRTDADAFARYSLHTYYSSLGLDRPRTVVHSRWEGSWRERIDAASMGNVACLYRRDALLAHPFEGSFAEDFDWAVRALKRGERLGKTSEATVVHSHTRSAFYALRRGFASRRLMRRFGVAEPLRARTQDEALSLLSVLYRRCLAEGSDPGRDPELSRFFDALRPWPQAEADDELTSVITDCEPFDDGDRPTWVLKALAGRLGWLLGDLDWTGARAALIEKLADGL